jgi:dihydroceramidase
MRILLFTCGLVFAVIHALYQFVVAFQLFFASLCLFCFVRLYRYYRLTKNDQAKELVLLYVRTGMLGTLCWLIDYHHCYSPINFFGHAWWHFFMGFNAYYGPLFMQYVRASQLDWSPTVCHAEIGLPTIVIDKSLHQD